MKIYKIAKHYSVNRDDSELRVVICPKCKKSDVKDLRKRVPIVGEDNPLWLYECNECKKYFSFYTEDGTREISKEEAIEGIKNKQIDLIEKGKDKGRDQHGHSYYIVFNEKPPTVSDKECDDMFEKDYDEYKKWKERTFLKANLLMKNKDLITKIDFDWL